MSEMDISPDGIKEFLGNGANIIISTIANYVAECKVFCENQLEIISLLVDSVSIERREEFLTGKSDGGTKAAIDYATEHGNLELKEFLENSIEKARVATKNSYLPRLNASAKVRDSDNEQDTSPLSRTKPKSASCLEAFKSMGCTIA
jgi:hypothetical protein